MTVLKCVINYFKAHLGILFETLIIIIASTLLSLVPPQLLRIILDDIVPQNDISLILIYALFYMLSYIAISIITFLQDYLLVKISQNCSKIIRLNMLEKTTRLSYKVFSKLDSGSLEAYFTNDVEEINTLITSGVISMAIDSLKIIGIIVSIFVFSVPFGFITLGILPFIVIFTLWIRKKMFKAQSDNRKLEGMVNDLVSENVDNINTIKSFRIYKSAKEKYYKVLACHFSSNQKSNTYDAIFPPTMQIIKFFLIVLIIILSTINNDIFGMKIGVLVSSIDLISNLFSPIESLGMELQTIQKSLAAIRRLNEFFKFEEDDIKELKFTQDKNEPLVLKFENVSFSYDGKENVLENFNLEMKNNEHLTLKGRSGSGKSTIFKLAYGLIKPTEGRVTINGVDTYLLDNESKKNLFGIVYQDYFFSGGTIKEEITLLNDNIDDKKIYDTLKQVGLDRIKDIEKPLVPTDYSTGELSLFNIARAIILDSKILFLDEMNAKVDAVTAKKIISTIDEVSKDKLVLSINHYGELLKDSSILNVEK